VGCILPILRYQKVEGGRKVQDRGEGLWLCPLGENDFFFGWAECLYSLDKQEPPSMKGEGEAFFDPKYIRRTPLDRNVGKRWISEGRADSRHGSGGAVGGSMAER